MRFLELRILAPTVIAMTCLTDVSLRFALTPERIAFRAWEAAAVNSTAAGPFTPNVTYLNVRSYGDLSNLGNLPSLRAYRREYFTTDAQGFRNTPAAPNRSVKFVVVGDSFTVGAGLSDADTLSGQLAAMSQSGALNLGNYRNWPDIEKLIRARHVDRGVVVWQVSERSEPLEGGEMPFGMRILKSLLPNGVYSALRTGARYSMYSPLKIVLSRMFRKVQNDEWLPNVAAGSVIRKRLPNGQEMIFLHSEVNNFGRNRGASPEFFVQLQTAVRATNNELLVVMVPDKYNVYYPLLPGSSSPPAEESTTLGMLARNLRANGVLAVDFTPVFRQAAAEALRNNQYIYWTDDTHWNPAGVRIAAREILKVLPQSSFPPGSPGSGSGGN